MNQKIFLTIILFSTVFALPAFAQTREETREKYKDKLKLKIEEPENVDVYDIKPKISASFFYDRTQQLYQITVKPFTSNIKKSPIEMPYPQVQEILDDILPVGVRGRFCGDFDFESGRNRYLRSVYEIVTIEMDIHNSTAIASNGAVGAVQIDFVSSKCR